MPNPKKLYGMRQIAETLSVTRNWVNRHMYLDPSLAAGFEGPNMGGKEPITHLWSEEGLNRWMRYVASNESLPKAGLIRNAKYSDHKAVNIIAGGHRLSWKLWWRCKPDGATQWWYSTPDGWYTSDDYGQEWVRTGKDVRDTDYHYYCVNTYDTVRQGSCVVSVLRSCHQLRKRLEEEAA